MKVDLTLAEIESLYNIASYVVAKGHAQDDPPLTSAALKLKRIGHRKLCKHCRNRFARRKDRICDACNTYRAKFGSLPKSEVLQQRVS